MEDDNRLATRQWIEQTFNVMDWGNALYNLPGTRCLSLSSITRAYKGVVKAKSHEEYSRMCARGDLKLDISGIVNTPFYKNVTFYTPNGENYHKIMLFRYTSQSNRVKVGTDFNPDDHAGDSTSQKQTLYPIDWSTETWYLGVYIEKAWNGVGGTDWDKNDRNNISIQGFYNADHTGDFTSGRYIYTGVNYNKWLLSDTYDIYITNND